MKKIGFFIGVHVLLVALALAFSDPIFWDAYGACRFDGDCGSW